MKAELFFDARHELGEGPLWHGDRGELFWFSINAGELNACAADASGHRVWSFGEPASAAAIVDSDTLLVAVASGLERFAIATGERTPVCSFPAADPATRSNDGRAGPAGTFWIGTMGLAAEAGAGAFYQFSRGKLALKLANVTVPNATCFSPHGDRAYFCDTKARTILQWHLDPDTGETIGEPEVFLDLNPEGINPDGSVCDGEGCIWNAQWGARRVARYDPRGKFIEEIEVPSSQVTCPAFGGSDLKTLFVTSAWENMDAAARARDPLAGSIFAAEVSVAGIPEFRVELARS